MELRVLWWSNVLNSALPPHRLRPDTETEHQDPVRHMVIILSSGGPTVGQGELFVQAKIQLEEVMERT